MSAEQLYTLFDTNGKSLPVAAVSIAGEPVLPVPLDQIAPAQRCLYCQKCGLFLGTYIDDAPHAPFQCAFVEAKFCLCTLPTETLCCLLGDVEGVEPPRVARERLFEAYKAAGCDNDEATLGVCAFFPLSLPVRRWLFRHLHSRAIWEN